MNVLHVYKDFHPGRGGGGVARHIDGLVSNLNPEKYGIRIAAISAQTQKYICPVYEVNFITILKHLLWCDILHIHGGRILISGYAALVAYILRKKIVYSMHCYYDVSPFFKRAQKKMWDLFVERPILNRANSLILPSHYWKYYLLKKGLKLDNLSIVPNCVTFTNAFTNAKTSTKDNQVKLSGSPSILYVGRLDPIKRVEDLLSVLLEDGMSDATLHVVGSGPHFDYLKNFAKSCKVESRVIFYGFLDDIRVKDLIRKIDVFALPSLQEGMPTVLIEMILSRCMVVASNIPGNLSILIPLDLKTHFSVCDTKSLRDSILQSTENVISEIQVEKAKKLFTWEENIYKIESIYDKFARSQNHST